MLNGVILQEGIPTTLVKPNVRIQLVAEMGDWWNFTQALEFLVLNVNTGETLVRQYVGVRWPAGKAWLDWISPEPGLYNFYPDSASAEGYVRFEVSENAPTQPKGEQPPIITALSEGKWIAIAAAVIAVVVLASSYIPKPRR
jgi:hypothetical protein